MRGGCKTGAVEVVVTSDRHLVPGGSFQQSLRGGRNVSPGKANRCLPGGEKKGGGPPDRRGTDTQYKDMEELGERDEGCFPGRQEAGTRGWRNRSGSGSSDRQRPGSGGRGLLRRKSGWELHGCLHPLSPVLPSLFVLASRINYFRRKSTLNILSHRLVGLGLWGTGFMGPVVSRQTHTRR